MKVAYALEQTSLAGGHKDVFEQANRLADRGHDVHIASVAQDASGWFPLRVANRVCGTYEALTEHLRSFDGVRVATWWKTAQPVAKAGGGAYFIQDVETSYASSPVESQQVLSTYRAGLTMFTESRWVQDEMVRLALPRPFYVGIGVDPDVFCPQPGLERPATDMVLFHERDHFLKGPELRAQVLQLLKRQVTTVGYSPWGPNRWADRHLRGPSDEQLADYMRRGLCLLVTSRHEGLCMPAMEAMASGLPVVTTAAQGNWFCEADVNCLMGSTAQDLVGHVLRLRKDPGLWLALREAGLETVREHFGWDETIDRLEDVLEAVAERAA